MKGLSLAQLVLASASPRRHYLMALMGLSFEISASHVPEDALSGEHPRDMAMRLSLAKARATAGYGGQDVLIVAADTLVALGHNILGKPSNEEEACEMLRRLRNRRHTVYSGLALIDTASHREQIQMAETPVLMRNYTDVEIRRYVASGDPMDKAGAYAIQHPSFEPVARIDGCFANVMGLPMCHLYQAMKAWGFGVPVHPLLCCPLAVTSGCCWSTEVAEPPPAVDRSDRT